MEGATVYFSGKKSRIRETKHLSTDADGSTAAKKLLSLTLRSWVHEVFSRFGTVSLGLGDNYASKCGSGIFPHSKYMSRCVENSQNHTLLLRFSPIPGRRFEKQGELCPIGRCFENMFLEFISKCTLDKLQIVLNPFKPKLCVKMAEVRITQTVN